MIDREALARSVGLPLEKFLQWEKQEPGATYLRQPHGGTWKTYTYGEAAREVRSIAAALKALNLPRGSSIALVSKNCAQWPMADLAIWMAGHVAVPLYANLSAGGFRKLLDHSETKAVFVGKMDSFQAIEEALPQGAPVIYFPFKR
jgi:long-chain acyl-CoA synthetase